MLGAPPPSGPAGSLSPHQWQDVIKYISADDLKALRLAGGKQLHLADPSLTCHLQLRMDKAPFFSSDDVVTVDRAQQWLTNRRRLVLNDVSSKICPHRLAYLVAHGYLNSVTEVVVFDCHLHRTVVALLAMLPNLESLSIASHASDQEAGVLDELEFIVASVGKIQSLKSLDMEFDCVIHGSRLSFLRNQQGLRHLRLRGFDLSEGISSMGGLRNLSTLHLCHGNFFSSPSNDVNEKALIALMGLTNLTQVHLEGFDCLSDVGLKFGSRNSLERLVLKHCQDLDPEIFPSIGRMGQLNSLHLVHSSYDDVAILSVETLQHLNSLSALKSLSLFYVLEDISDLSTLWGLSSLETLNIALEDELDEEDVDYLCHSILPTFGSLRKLRIFSEEGMSFSVSRGKLDVEYAPFTFGDLVYLE
ncbi:hypothetical protein ACHAWF_009516 [Thalassiosira exigua]